MIKTDIPKALVPCPGAEAHGDNRNSSRKELAKAGISQRFSTDYGTDAHSTAKFVTHACLGLAAIAASPS
jgi:hypothetical protein